MMEEHVTDQFLHYTEYTDENRRHLRALYEDALKGDEDSLVELMNEAYDSGYRDAYG